MRTIKSPRKISAAFQTLYRPTRETQVVCLFVDGKGGREKKREKKGPSSYEQTKRKGKKRTPAGEKKKLDKAGSSPSGLVIIQLLNDKSFRRAIVVVGEVLVRSFDKVEGSRKTCERVKKCLSLKSQTPKLLMKLIVKIPPPLTSFSSTYWIWCWHAG